MSDPAADASCVGGRFAFSISALEYSSAQHDQHLPNGDNLVNQGHRDRGGNDRGAKRKIEVTLRLGGRADRYLEVPRKVTGPSAICPFRNVRGDRLGGATKLAPQ